MRCSWLLLVALGFISHSSRTAAQPAVTPKDGKMVLPLTLSPAKTAVPALRYQLLPELRDMQPGNQVPAFYKCFMEQNNLYHAKETIDKRDKWLAAPLSDLANEKDLIGYGGSSSKQADYAARLESVDWAVLTQLKAEGVYLLLPDIQQLRSLGQVLKLKMRGEVARKEYDSAIHTAQTLLALARALDHHPTLIGNLVGLAIEGIALTALEELIQQPGAPNLFWALIHLPDPVVGIRAGMQGERSWLTKDYDILEKPDPIPQDQLNRLLNSLDLIVAMSEGPVTEKKATMWYNHQLEDKANLASAKARLVKLGFKADALDKLSPLQLVMMDDYAIYEAARDDLMKWTNIPFWRIPADFGVAKDPPGMFTQIIPACQKVRRSVARMQQHIAMLAAVEAIRAYAAENIGSLPPSLEAIKLPLPIDPFTGKPLRYEVTDSMAVLRGTPPELLKAEPTYNRVYEITIRK